MIRITDCSPGAVSYGTSGKAPGSTVAAMYRIACVSWSQMAKKNGRFTIIRKGSGRGPADIPPTTPPTIPPDTTSVPFSSTLREITCKTRVSFGTLGILNERSER